MDGNRLETVIRALTVLPSRRGVLRALAGAGFGLGMGTVRWPAAADARKKRKRKKKNKKPKLNTFGCVNVGGFCKNSGQCCSGICEGKKGKKKCQAHDTGGCTGEQDVCAGNPVPCVTATDENGGCVRTTGGAGYCNGGGNCFSCRKDTDCQAVCGPQAACIVCESECGPNGTACVSPSVDSCMFME